MKAMLAGAIILVGGAFVASPAQATEYPQGDANCSGVVTQDDVQLLIDVILEKPGAALGSCGAVVDLNCDGALNIFDVTRLRKLANGQEIPACSL